MSSNWSICADLVSLLMALSLALSSSSSLPLVMVEFSSFMTFSRLIAFRILMNICCFWGLFSSLVFVCSLATYISHTEFIGISVIWKSRATCVICRTKGMAFPSLVITLISISPSWLYVAVNWSFHSVSSE